MRVLVACEFSGVVRDAFARLGHDAWSCDLIKCPWGNHYQGDVLDILDDGWDIMIAHPPCTHLCVTGARWFNRKGKTDLQEKALQFVRTLMNCSIGKICIENPIGLISTKIRKPTQIIQPWQFGHGVTKATCLWLKNLTKLVPTQIVHGRRPKSHMTSGKHKSRIRAVTYHGIAQAMASQWGGDIK